MSKSVEDINALLMDHLKADRQFISKDYLSEKEAAEFCCVCQTQFRDNIQKYNIISVKHMGKKVYRKSDLIHSIESKFKNLKIPH